MVRATVVQVALGVGLSGAAASWLVQGCTEDDVEASVAPASQTEDSEPATPYDGTEEEPTSEREARARQERLDRDYPLHGVVTGVQLAVREAADPESAVLGWLRIGARIRLKPEPTTTSNCASGWYRIAPRGWGCAGLGIEVDDEPPDVDVATKPPDHDAPLPYAYHFVKENMVPEYHRLPSRDEQRAAQAYADRYFELHEDDESRAERFLEGELPGEQARPAVVRRFLERGFYVAGTGVEERAFRHFVRTVRGSYVKKARTVAHTGSELEGVELDDERTLPVAFALRAIRPLVRKPGEAEPDRFVDDEEAEAIERQAVVEGWSERERVGKHIYHRFEVDGEPRYAREWFIGVAEKTDPPFDVREDEPWVHVDLGDQTLVLYRGEEPTYATLVSTGLEDHETPTGVFPVKKKLLSATMSDLGPEAGDDRYRIEDVPWTQYFKGSVALHGTFWHNRFGLQRSHGCVNLSPRDAHRIFRATWPRVPEGWHGVTTDRTELQASRVVITE